MWEEIYRKIDTLKDELYKLILENNNEIDKLKTTIQQLQTENNEKT